MKWIKTSDRLPDKNGEVIVFNGGGVVTRIDFYKPDRVFLDSDDCELDEVSYWMPLPTPPRTKENFKIDEFDYKNYHYSEDVKRIVQVAYDNEIFLSPYEAYNIWEVYSDGMCAGWLYLPTDDEELLEIIKDNSR